MISSSPGSGRTSVKLLTGVAMAPSTVTSPTFRRPRMPVFRRMQRTVSGVTFSGNTISIVAKPPS